MPWRDEPYHPFAGIFQRLKRADEDIVNLSNEITRFFESSKYPVIPEANTKEWQEATDYHKNLAIPLRFSVLSGEIIHHLRSCLDNIAWHFSCTQYRLDHETAISFPIVASKPTTKKEIASYKRKIEGITKINVRNLIESVQPYQRGDDAIDDPLLIVHDMDRFDKHRELTIIGSVASLRPISEAGVRAMGAMLKMSEGQDMSPDEAVIALRAIKQDVKVTPQIAFPKFGKREYQLVIPAFSQLFYAVSDTIDLFATEV